MYGEPANVVIDLSNKETDERFGAMVIAVQNGHIHIARQIFDMSLEIAAINALDQAIEALNKTGNSRSCEVISILKAKDSNYIR